MALLNSKIGSSLVNKWGGILDISLYKPTQRKLFFLNQSDKFFLIHNVIIG